MKRSPLICLLLYIMIKNLLHLSNIHPSSIGILEAGCNCGKITKKTFMSNVLLFTCWSQLRNIANLLANELSVSVSLMFHEGRRQRHSNILPEIVILYENAKCSEILFRILWNRSKFVTRRCKRHPTPSNLHFARSEAFCVR